ncbi:hypothetical protein [Geomicrobium sp. JCM 19055]|uniref:hypothetical protein n=1 Tax=Geomicrobium sp. JCM 19055 TaxID=1460649 RepID=UPI00187BF02B|nr:hypothetical protein [Geomicrobium sp. JCM 19055]
MTRRSLLRVPLLGVYAVLLAACGTQSQGVSTAEVVLEDGMSQRGSRENSNESLSD